jgi:hypothetical protein
MIRLPSAKLIAIGGPPKGRLINPPLGASRGSRPSTRSRAVRPCRAMTRAPIWCSRGADVAPLLPIRTSPAAVRGRLHLFHLFSEEGGCCSSSQPTAHPGSTPLRPHPWIASGRGMVQHCTMPAWSARPARKFLTTAGRPRTRCRGSLELSLGLTFLMGPQRGRRMTMMRWKSADRANQFGKTPRARHALRPVLEPCEGRQLLSMAVPSHRPGERG